MTVSRIKNVWVRRSVLCAVTPFFIVAMILLGTFSGILQKVVEFFDAFENAWKGQ